MDVLFLHSSQSTTVTFMQFPEFELCHNKFRVKCATQAGNILYLNLNVKSILLSSSVSQRISEYLEEKYFSKTFLYINKMKKKVEWIYNAKLKKRVSK